MHTIRGNITKLINQMEKQYPNEINDEIYQKEIVIQELRNIYKLIDIFKPYQDTLDVRDMRNKVLTNIQELSTSLENENFSAFKKGADVDYQLGHT
ncbi:hypothetical protein ACKLNO_01680 [Neisseriaceae bacterium B1]